MEQEQSPGFGADLNLSHPIKIPLAFRSPLQLSLVLLIILILVFYLISGLDDICCLASWFTSFRFSPHVLI